MDEEELSTKTPMEDVVDGEVIIAKAYEPLTIGVVHQLMELGYKNVEVIDTKEDDILVKSLRKDPSNNEEEALKDIYRRLRPGDPPTTANSKALLKRLFFDGKKYDLTRVGRYKINQKLHLKVDEGERILTSEDFVAAILAADKVPMHQFEDVRPFEGCLPIEVMAERGLDTLRFGPLKPVGLPHPETGEQFHAVVQLRQENALGTLYNLVGFQTKMTWTAQQQIFRPIPALEEAEFVRLRSIPRNTFLNSPK